VPSPAATASLTIGKAIVDMAIESLVLAEPPVAAASN
jgi:hypothetical protein